MRITLPETSSPNQRWSMDFVSERLVDGRPRAKGKKLGRPRVYPDQHRIAALRAEGLSWAKIAERLGVGEGTIYRAAQASSKNHSRTADKIGLGSAAD